MTKRDDPQHVRHTLRTKQVLILEQDEATREVLQGHFGHAILQPDPQAYLNKDFAALTGRYYGLVSQYKCDDAETVFVSLGSAAENIEAAVDYLRQREGAKVGSIHINVIRPFPEAAVVKAVGGSVRIEFVGADDPGDGAGPGKWILGCACAAFPPHGALQIFRHRA